MNKVKKDTRWLTSVALMAAVVILLANTPLGMIQLPVIKATTVHIPVILGAVILGPAAGAILGGVFGLCSMISNTMAPTLLSFAFSPFFKHFRDTRGSESRMDFRGLPDSDRRGCRMALDFVKKNPYESDRGSGGNRVCRLDGQYHYGYGKHLSSAGRAVRRGAECRGGWGVCADYGNRGGFRHSGGGSGGGTDGIGGKSADSLHVVFASEAVAGNICIRNE